MRGKAVRCTVGLYLLWITPAHAGKRDKPASSARACTDHPRTCGEKLQDFFKASYAWGSPPHMRGKVLLFQSALFVFGITPAHAGKSFIRIIRELEEWDHPRTCGEKFHLI